MDVHFPPGAHLALTVNGITREYSPIAGYLHVEAATGIPNPHIEIMIRMVPNGALSGLLNQLLSLDTCGSSAIPLLGVTMPCHVPCTVYGPLYPAPATFGYLPYYLPPPRITSAAVTASSSTPVPMLVMIAGIFIPVPHNDIRPLCELPSVADPLLSPLKYALVFGYIYQVDLELLPFSQSSKLLCVTPEINENCDCYV